MTAPKKTKPNNTKGSRKTPQQNKSPKLKSNPKIFRILVGLLVLEAMLLYINTSNHGFVLDDMSAIESNWVTKRGVEGLPIIFKNSYRYGYWSNKGTLYRPLSLAMFAIEWEISPNNPSVHHWVNILMYGLLAALLFSFLNALFKEQKPVLAFVATALFLAHPIHTEVVANIKSRDELLSFTLIIGSLRLFLWWLDKKKAWTLLTAVVLYFLAFLSKESAITFLAVFPLVAYFFRGASIKSALIGGAYFLPAALAYLGIRRSILGSVGGVEAVDLIDNLLVAVHGTERFATAIKIIGMYIGKLLFPHPLSNDYSYNQIEAVGLGSPAFLISMALILFLAFVAIRGFKGRRLISFAILYFAITFSLYTNLIITIGTSFGERLLFVPSLGFSLIVAHYLTGMLKPSGVSSSLNQAGNFSLNAMPMLLGAVLLIAYSGKTVSRNKAWASNMTLYETDVKTVTNSARSHYYYGMGTMTERAMKTENIEERNRYLKITVEEMERAIEIYPNYVDAHGSLGLAWYRLGNEEKALKYYDQAIALQPTAIILNNKAVIHFNRGEIDYSLETYKKIVELDPRYVDGLRGMASCYGMKKEYDKAVEYFLKAIEYEPESPELWIFLGRTYNFMNRPNDARKAFEQARALRPGLAIPELDQTKQ
ncbi:MAG: tetratricopeptide repeat protein [Flavobacteriales bacterium]|nr:tetratricopeptide repeat protein [Flavobacteriales bacterium]